MRDTGNEVGNFAPEFKSTKSNLSPMILVICLCKLLNYIPLVKFRKKAKNGYVYYALLPTRQPSEDARLARLQHYRAVRRRKKAQVFVR